ncbi:MAG: hypothetical protein PHU56_01315 [Candidatus Pacebacteria bacterium]|nr:hypothetical protein [Candidatus Paceibacterota bacterium]
MSVENKIMMDGESMEEAGLSLEAVKRKNYFHHLFDEIKREKSIEKMDELQKQYIGEFGYAYSEKDAVALNADTEQKLRFAKDNVNLFKDYLSSLSPDERQAWLARFQEIEEVGAVEGLLSGFKPACYIKEEDADFILSAMKGRNLFIKTDNKASGYCFLYNPDNALEVVKNNLDIFVDLIPKQREAILTKDIIRHIFDNLDPRLCDYLVTSRTGLMLGYYRPDVEMFAKYRIFKSTWENKEIFQNSATFSSPERYWLQLFSFISRQEDRHCLDIVDNIIGDNVWPEGFSQSDRTAMTDFLCKVKESIKRNDFFVHYLEFANALQSIIYQRILEKVKMSPFLKSYFLNSRNISINETHYISYGYNEIHKAIISKAERLLTQSGLKSLVEGGSIGSRE